MFKNGSMWGRSIWDRHINLTNNTIQKCKDNEICIDDHLTIVKYTSIKYWIEIKNLS